MMREFKTCDQLYTYLRVQCKKTDKQLIETIMQTVTGLGIGKEYVTHYNEFVKTQNPRAAMLSAYEKIKNENA